MKLINYIQFVAFLENFFSESMTNFFDIQLKRNFSGSKNLFNLENFIFDCKYTADQKSLDTCFLSFTSKLLIYVIKINKLLRIAWKVGQNS